MVSDDSSALPPSSIRRRVGLAPAARACNTSCTCPDIYELEDGNFAVVGTNRTKELRDGIPADGGVAHYEDIVVITRETLLAAIKDLT
jgi:hypothetical protein